MWWNWKRRRRRARRRPPMGGIHWSQATWKVPESRPRRERSRQQNAVPLTLLHWSSLSPIQPSSPYPARSNGSPVPILNHDRTLAGPPIVSEGDLISREETGLPPIRSLEDWARCQAWDWALVAWGGIQIWGLLGWCLIRAFPNSSRYETIAALVVWSLGWLGAPLALWWADRRANPPRRLDAAPSTSVSAEVAEVGDGLVSNSPTNSPTHHDGARPPERKSISSPPVATFPPPWDDSAPSQHAPEPETHARSNEENEEEVDLFEEIRALAFLFVGVWAGIGVIIIAWAGFDQFFRAAFDYDGRLVLLVSAPLLSLAWFWSSLLITRKLIPLGMGFAVLTPLSWVEPGWLEPVILLSWPLSCWVGAAILRARWRSRRRRESRLRAAPTLGVVYAALLQKVERFEDFYED